MIASGRIGIACFVVAILSLAACSAFPESCFDLAGSSRLPGWFKLPADLERKDVAVHMCYYIGANGSTATFVMRNAKTQAKLADITGAVRDLYPIVRSTDPAAKYPGYSVITAGGITEAVEHRRMEPIFYVVDDPAVRHELGIVGR
ncbi:MAG TPA: hypothetical protein VFV97_07470 [Rhodanobacteraceae bacterium]|nr:hypothetical protein [Rhodanobacteraceae bacterium]